MSNAVPSWCPDMTDSLHHHAIIMGRLHSQNLDFDFEKCCSVSLSPVNVYACLVCGKYFQGRGPHTHAYTHALECGHHMYMKLDNGKVRRCH